MKKSLSPMTVFCALLFLLTIAGCQKSATTPTPTPTPAPSLQSMIIGKWNIDTAIFNTTQYGVSSADTTPFTPSDYCDFKADSTLSIMAEGVAYNGNWRIDSSKLFISGTNYLDNPDGYELPILDQHNLQLYYTSSTPNTSLVEKLNLSK